MDLAGPPFHVHPDEALGWTLPQVLFAWLKTQETQMAGARQTFSLTLAAIGSVFAKDGKKIAQSVIDSLSGPATSVDEWRESLSEEQRKVLFGSKGKQEQE